MHGLEKFSPEFIKPLLLSLGILKWTSIHFFDKGNTFIQKYWQLFILAPSFILHFITTTLYLIEEFNSDELNMMRFAFMLPVYIIVIEGFLKYIIILYNKSKIATLIIELEMMWRTENLTDKHIAKKELYMKKLHLNLKVWYIGNMLAIWLNLMKPLTYVIFKEIIDDHNVILELPFDAVYPFDPAENWMIYLVVYLFQIYIMGAVAYVFFGIDMFLITLCAHLTTEFAVLTEDLRNIKPQRTKMTHDRQRATEYHYAIKDFVRNHQKLLELSELMNDIFNKMVFIKLFLVSVIICFFGICLQLTRDPKERAVHLIDATALLMPILMDCYYSELLIEESSSIAEAAYENLWYNGDIHYQKCIRLIIQRSQRFCSLTSLYAPITLATFTKVISTTWSYFSLIMNTYSAD